jgi:hypothetical protein
MSFLSDTNSVLSSPPSILETSSPCPDYHGFNSDREDTPYSNISEVHNDEVLLPPNGPTVRIRRKRKSPPQSSWVWGPPESPNGKLVILNEVSYVLSLGNNGLVRTITDD